MHRKDNIVVKNVYDIDLNFMTNLNEKFKNKLTGVYQVYDPMSGQLFLSSPDKKIKPMPYPVLWLL